VAKNLSSLRIGQRVLSFSDDGLLVAEYSLFDAAGIVLHSTDPVSVREAGYMTTAGQALERLRQEGVTPELALEASAALRSDVAVTYARTEVVRGVVEQLGAQELFDGAIFRAGTSVYEGAWLDLRGLASGLAAPNAPLLLQALHLAASLAEVPADTALNLSTAAVTRTRRPGERTFQRATFDGVGNVPDQLRHMSPRTTQLVDPALEARLRPVLLARVRERLGSHASPLVRAHLAALEKGLSPRTGSEPPGAADLRTLERQIDEGDPTDLDERLDRLEAARGSTPALRYLRARAALMRGQKPPRYVAQELSELAEIDHGFHEAALGAARSWLAAGEQAQARRFAHQVADDPSATDSKRLVALEILDATPQTHQSREPPPIEALAETMPAIPQQRAPNFPWLGQMPPPTGVPPAMSIPPQPAAEPVARTKPPRARYVPELVEALLLPPGTSETDLALDALPTSPAQARIAMTRLSRDLARDYRLWYDKTLRCGVMAIEAMQQHLLARFQGADIADPGVAWELRRHGALMSEVIARSLGGQWVDVRPSEPGFWTMRVAGSTRTYPIGRVYRFVTAGRQERGLVEHFLALDERVRTEG
jgi:hypothetical protein